MEVCMCPAVCSVTLRCTACKKNLRKLLLYLNILNVNFVGHETGIQKKMMFFKWLYNIMKLSTCTCSQLYSSTLGLMLSVGMSCFQMKIWCLKSFWENFSSYRRGCGRMEYNHTGEFSAPLSFWDGIQSTLVRLTRSRCKCTDKRA